MPLDGGSEPPASQYEAGSADVSMNQSRYCDPRLEELKIGYWSDVQITDEAAARLISLYLETDHPILGVFDADLFVTDLINNRPRYCSRLLVASVLSWSSVSRVQSLK